MKTRSGPNWENRTVLLVLRTLAMGGTERQVGYLAPWLRAETGARVVVWALERGGAQAGLLERHGIDWEVHSKLLHHHGVAKLPALIDLFWRIRQLRPDAILSFNDFPNKVCGAIWPWTGAKTCIWNQRDEGREVTGRFLEQRALQQVKVFTANSIQGVEFLTNTFGISRERITIIHNGVELDPPKRTRGEWRAEIGISPQAILVTMIANLHHFKDHETLLRAWAQIAVKTDKVGLHLVLAGHSGDTFTMLHDLCERLSIKNNVHFTGLTDDISGLLAASDIGVFSSRLEGMPNGVIESMAAGLPMTATRIAGIAEALGEDYPLLVQPGDAPELARNLLTLIGDEKLRRRLGERNQKRACEKFSVASMGRQFVDILSPFLTHPLGKAE